jgi:prevent-host-death family protein
MEISITEFRRALFDVIAKVFAGQGVVITYKGKRFRVVSVEPADRLDRLSPGRHGFRQPRCLNSRWSQAIGSGSAAEIDANCACSVLKTKLRSRPCVTTLGAFNTAVRPS